MNNRTIAMARELTQARLKELLSYDPETGVFTNLVRRGSRAMPGAVAGTICKTHGYVKLTIDGLKYQGHRVAFLYVEGRWPDPECDHENGVRHDNRWANLREATRAEQSQNLAVKRNNKTKLKGVHYNARRNRYRARITVGGAVHLLGQSFPTAEAAHAAYVEAKARLHPFQPTVRF